MTLAQADLDLLQQFERGLDPLHPERSRIPARILGYGEISTVFAIQVERLRGLAFKRLPIFYTLAEVERYRAAFQEYLRLLAEEIGLDVADQGHAVFLAPSGRPVFYIIQPQMPAASIGNQALHRLGRDDLVVLIQGVLRELRKVWDFNRRQDRLRVAIDGQISNWAINGFDPENPDLQGTSLSYLDTSTPLFRVDGVEQLDTELFLRSAPSFLAWILRRFFLQDVVDRYYDFHLVAVDLAANFLKEQRPDLIPAVVSAVHDFFSGEAADLGVAPIGEKEVRDYYRQDALIWTLYLAMRKIDRFIRRRLLHRPYPYILPEKVKR